MANFYFTKDHLVILDENGFSFGGHVFGSALRAGGDGLAIDSAAGHALIFVDSNQVIDFDTLNETVAFAVPFTKLQTTGRILGSQGAAVASASTVTLGNDGNTFDITGTTTINVINTTGWTPGSMICLRFTGNLTLNNGAGGDGQLYTTTGANKAIAAGAESWFVLRNIGGTLYWRETAYDA